MPFRRRFTRRRPVRRRFARRGPSKSVKKYVRRAVNRIGDARRTWELTAAPFEAISTVSITDLSDSIAQGDTAGTREGDIVKLNGYRGRIRLERKAAATAATNEGYRILLVQWLVDDTTDPPTTLGELFYDTTNYDTIILGPPVTLTTFNKYRVRILGDWRGFTTAAASGRGTKMIHVNIPAKRMRRIVFSPGANTGFNKLFLVVYGESATGNETNMVSYYFSANFSCRTR